MKFNEYIHLVIKHGRFTFSIEEAVQALHKSRKAVQLSIEHLVAKKELVSPAKGFYVIVPPEYQVIGCLPAEYFVPSLMEYWKCEYYACLLTAAKYHGASHQAVMIFQVMVDRPKRPIICGKVKIQFVTNKNLFNTPTQKIATRMSMLTVSTPEGTAMDLLNYPKKSVGLDHIATVMAELHEAINPAKLLELAQRSSSLAWQQRLGYILELVNANELADVLKEHLSKQKRVDWILLSPKVQAKRDAKKNLTWKIIENIKIESDI